MRKAFLEPLLQVQALKKQLEYEQTGKRCQLLIFKADHWNLMVFCRNLCFTGFHLRWPPG
jgi:hypothetical protein